MNTGKHRGMKTVIAMGAVIALLAGCSQDTEIQADSAASERLKPVGEVVTAKAAATQPAVVAAPVVKTEVTTAEVVPVEQAVTEAATEVVKEVAPAATAAIAAVTPATGASADGAATYTAKGCAACHGADAKTAIAPAYPHIAGQTKEYLSQQMQDIKSGARSNGQSAAMKGIMAGVSDAEIEILAEYLAGLGY